jgi:hypothetical protein
MPSSCRACSAPTVGWRNTGTLCGKHRNRDRINGDPRQSSIFPSELKEPLKYIRRRRKAKPEASIWGHLVNRWSTLVSIARHDLGPLGENRRVIWSRQANETIDALGLEADPQQIIDTVLAMHLLRHHQPHRFVSDKAFRFQVVKAVRKLAPSTKRTYVSKQTWRRVTTVIHLRARSTELVAAIFLDAFGVAGLVLCQIADKEQQDRQDDARAYAAAVEDFLAN